MNVRILAAALVLAVGGTTVAAAQDPAPAPPAPAAHTLSAGAQGHYWEHGHGRMHDHGHHDRMRHRSTTVAVIHTLGRIERLYRMEGKRGDIEALYRDVLKRTDNPLVRRFAYARLARNEMRPGATAKAVATLRQSLDESLKQLDRADARRKQRSR